MSSTSNVFFSAYHQLNGSHASAVGCSRLTAINSLGDQHSLYYWGGDVRLRAFKGPADFDTGWNSCQANVTYSFNHAIGAVPTLAIVEVAENSDGTGWRAPTMSSNNYDGSWRQTSIVNLNETTVVVRTQGVLAEFCNSSQGGYLTPAAGYCRVQLYTWTPDFDSGWVAVSTAAGDRDKWFRHRFGAEPSLVMLWVAENNDGSGWVLPAMSAIHHYYTHGVGLYALTEEWAVVKGGASSVAYFVDADGVEQAPASGYIRLLAWR
jgi:hypothetical protein